jgi:putative DNA primase/helicase
LPRLLDLSEGFFRRAIILTFNRQFAQHEQDANLESRLFAELPGILVWSMEGLQRLRARGRFEVPMSSVAALNTYRQEADPIGLFVEDCLDRVENRGMRSSEIYEGYSKWCKANGYAPKNNSGFGKRLKELGLEGYRTAEGSCWKVNVKAGNRYVWGEAEVCGVAPAVIEPASGSRYRL